MCVINVLSGDIFDDIFDEDLEGEIIVIEGSGGEGRSQKFIVEIGIDDAQECFWGKFFGVACCAWFGIAGDGW